MTTHSDLQRDLGRVEGAQESLERRVDELKDAVESGFQNIEKTFKRYCEDMEKRVRKLEDRETERKGAVAIILAMASSFAGVVGALVTKWLG